MGSPDLERDKYGPYSPDKNRPTFHCKLFDTFRLQLLTKYLFLETIFFVLSAFCAFKVDI